MALIWLAAAVLAAPVTLTDDVGRRVVLPEVPARIVSTSPSNTEALFALGAGDRVVGVTTLCVDPPEARSRTKIGDFSNLDFERLVALKPDLVVATWLEQRRHVERMESLGLTVLVLYPANLEETLASLLTLGRAVGRETEAKAMITGLRSRLTAIAAKVEKIPIERRPWVFVELGRSPLYTAGPGSTVDEAIRLAGGRNVASRLGKPYGTIGREAVIAADPEVVIAGMSGDAGAGAAFASEPGFAKLRAVRNGRVHERIDPALLFHQNHRLVEGIETLYRLFHGE